jgi:hypothetical protein
MKINELVEKLSVVNDQPLQSAVSEDVDLTGVAAVDAAIAGTNQLH